VRVQLEEQTPSGLISIQIENDRNEPVRLLTLDVSAEFEGHMRPVDWPTNNREIRANESVRYEITQYLAAGIQSAFPGLPDNSILILRVVPITEPGSSGSRAIFRVFFRNRRIFLSK
jgi:hypothetical protein